MSDAAKKDGCGVGWGVLSGEERSGEGRSRKDVVVVEIGVCLLLIRCYCSSVMYVCDKYMGWKGGGRRKSE